MSDAGANVHFRLVERPGGASESGLFGHGNRRGGLCGSGAGVNAGRNARTIRDGGALDARASLGDRRVGRRHRAGRNPRRPDTHAHKDRRGRPGGRERDAHGAGLRDGEGVNVGALVSHGAGKGVSDDGRRWCRNRRR